MCFTDCPGAPDAWMNPKHFTLTLRQICILKILRKNEMSAREIEETIDEISKYKMNMSSSNLYPNLQRLELLGLIDTSMNKSRKIYHLTIKGIYMNFWLAKYDDLDFR